MRVLETKGATPPFRDPLPSVGQERKNFRTFSKNFVAVRRRMEPNALAVRQPRQRLFLLAIALSIAGLVGGEWLHSRVTAPRKTAAKLATLVLPAERVVRFETPEAANEAPAVVAAGDRRVEELPASESAQFATLCDLHLMAGETELDLTSKQWEAFAVVFMQAQAVRHHYEAQIASVHEIAPGRCRVDIPPYVAAGDELRRQFAADLEAAVGRAAATEIMDKLGRKLDDRFAGFGIGTQTLEITGDPVRSPAGVQIASTAKFWNSVDGPDWTKTRKEVVFPDAEDPTGETWSALLAIVAKSE